MMIPYKVKILSAQGTNPFFFFLFWRLLFYLGVCCNRGSGSDLEQGLTIFFVIMEIIIFRYNYLFNLNKPPTGHGSNSSPQKEMLKCPLELLLSALLSALLSLSALLIALLNPL